MKKLITVLAIALTIIGCKKEKIEEIPFHEQVMGVWYVETNANTNCVYEVGFRVNIAKYLINAQPQSNMFYNYKVLSDGLIEMEAQNYTVEFSNKKMTWSNGAKFLIFRK